MTADSRIRILIADDHPVVLEGLVSMIEHEPDMEVVAQAPDGRQAVDLYLQHQPDVGLLDLRMPGMDGVDAIVAIRAQHAAARLILLTTYDGEEDIYRALRAGAKAYMLKDAEADDLLGCVRDVHAGRTCIPPHIGAKLAQRMNAPELTARELDVLRLMTRGCSNKEIAGQLNLSEGTIKVHVNNILQKLGSGSRTEAVGVALRRGLVTL